MARCAHAGGPARVRSKRCSAEACYAGTVDLYVQPPRSPRPWPHGPPRQPDRALAGAAVAGVTNLRHETLRIDDRDALHLLTLLDGTRAHDALAAALAGRPGNERVRCGHARRRVPRAIRDARPAPR